MTKITLKNVSKSFLSEDGEKQNIIIDFNYTIDKPEIITIIGPNGCGKSTLLNLISGLSKPDKGEINLECRNKERPNIGYIWQDYRSSLLPWFSVGDNISYPLRIKGVGKKERRKLVNELLLKLNNQIDFNQTTYKLSGGEQQLVNLLRSFAANPDFLLLDEPFSALDQSYRWSMAFSVEKMWMKEKIPTIFVSHDIDEAVMLADKVILMSRKPGNIEHIITNEMPRPRNVKMLSSNQHIKYREQVIEFLFEKGAIKN